MPAFLLDNKWVWWLAVAVVSMLIELATVSLVSIWFVAAALITAVCSLFIRNVFAQIMIFIALSALFLFLFQKFYRKRRRVSETPNKNLIGKTAVTVETVNENGGRVKTGDIYWRAVSGEEIAENSSVKITGIAGTTLIVEKK